MADLKTYWVSWWDTQDGQWTLYWPWWCTGYRDSGDGAYDERSMCAAIRATSEDDAREIVMWAHDERPDELEWRFVDEIDKPGWSPYSDRFPKADWMRWPEAATP